MSDSQIEQQVVPTEGTAAGQPEDAPPATPEPQETDWVAEARKWEKRAKENASRLKEAEPKLAEYDKFVQASQSELDRAQDAANKAQAGLAAMRETVAKAEVKAALTGVVPDPTAIADDLNLTRFINEDGGVNLDAVAALRDKYASLAPQASRTPAPNPAQGSSGSGPATPAQLSEADLTHMTPAQIVEAQNEGRLQNLGYGVKKS